MLPMKLEKYVLLKELMLFGLHLVSQLISLPFYLVTEKGNQ